MVCQQVEPDPDKLCTAPLKWAESNVLVLILEWRQWRPFGGHFATGLLTLCACRTNSLSGIQKISNLELQLGGRRERFFPLGCLWCKRESGIRPRLKKTWISFEMYWKLRYYIQTQLDIRSGYQHSIGLSIDNWLRYVSMWVFSLLKSYLTRRLQCHFSHTMNLTFV